LTDFSALHQLLVEGFLFGFGYDRPPPAKKNFLSAGDPILGENWCGRVRFGVF
jgi:hypothetical protein